MKILYVIICICLTVSLFADTPSYFLQRYDGYKEPKEIEINQDFKLYEIKNLPVEINEDIAKHYLPLGSHLKLKMPILFIDLNNDKIDEIIIQDNIFQFQGERPTFIYQKNRKGKFELITTLYSSPKFLEAKNGYLQIKNITHCGMEELYFRVYTFDREKRRYEISRFEHHIYNSDYYREQEKNFTMECKVGEITPINLLTEFVAKLENVIRLSIVEDGDKIWQDSVKFHQNEKIILEFSSHSDKLDLKIVHNSVRFKIDVKNTEFISLSKVKGMENYNIFIFNYNDNTVNKLIYNKLIQLFDNNNKII